MSIEKIRDAVREYLKANGWTKFNLYELTSRCFFYLAGYVPDITLCDASEIIRQLEIEQKIERKKNNGRNEL